MSRMSREYMRLYMAAKRAGTPRPSAPPPVDRPDTWPGEGHCRRCHLTTQGDLCVTCRFEIEQQRFPTRVSA